MSEHAAWWDDPNAAGDDTPVVRHAPNDGQYHVPDGEQMSKMPRMRSRSGRFAIIPAANKDGSPKAFDPTVAGPVHVDPDAPDGGVVFDPDAVRKSDVNRAVMNATYPHQAYYQLGQSAPSLGVGTRKQAAYAQAHHVQNGFDVDAGRNPHMPNTYVTPHTSAQPGRLSEVPTFVADGYGGGPASYNPTYRAQEEQAVNPVPPLHTLPPLGPQPVAAPQQVQSQAPPQQLAPAPQPYPPPQPSYPQPQAGYYAPPQPYQPPAMDPNMAAMMQAMVGMQQTVNALAQRVNQPAALPPTTGLSPVPLPTSRPQLTTQPVELGGRAPGRQQQDGDDFDDTAARPIRKQVKRQKGTQDIVEEQDDGRSLVRRTARERDRDEEPQQTVREYQEQDREPEGVIVGFESLNLKFVNGPLGNKPKRQVVFEIPGAGKHMARFHDIIDGAGCVVLVYDTRYEEGQQYVPPELDENTPITLHIKTGKDKVDTYKVGSMGLNYSFGVFDHIVMVKIGDQAVNYGGDEDE